MRRGWNAQLIEERSRHIGVVVLAGVDHHFRAASSGLDGPADNCRFDELGSGPDNRNHFYPAIHGNLARATTISG